MMSVRTTIEMPNFIAIPPDSESEWLPPEGFLLAHRCAPLVSDCSAGLE
jgi:hypothetical protein